MARTARTRSRSRLAATSSANGIWTIPVVYNSPVLTTEAISDSIGRPITDSALEIVKLDRSGVGGLMGSRAQDPTHTVAFNKYLAGYQFNGAIGHVPTGAPSPGSQGATVLSRTNPSRPTIVPFTLVQDLVSIPRMLKDVGRLVRTPRRKLSPKDLANHYLGARFGWLPLIDDAKKLLHLQQYIDSRVRELHSLYSSQGLRRKIQLGRNSANDSAVQFQWSDSFTGLLQAKVSYGTTTKTWGTVRWKPTNLPMPGWRPTDAEIIRDAIRTVSGFTTEGIAKGAWDLLPWTWIIDWYGNVGDWLTQSSSTVPASPSHLCIMQETITVAQHSMISPLPKGVTDSGGYVIRSTKTRTIGSGSLAASLPTLDASRLSILGALFVQRFKR